MKNCPKCYATNPNYANYCGKCGSQMIKGEQGKKVVVGKMEYEKYKSDSANIDFWVGCSIVFFLVLVCLLVFLIIKSVKLKKIRKEKVELVSSISSLEQKYNEEHDYMVRVFPLRIKQMSICNADMWSGKVLNEEDDLKSSSIVCIKPILTIEGYRASTVKAKCIYYLVGTNGKRNLIGTSNANLSVTVGQFKTMVCGMGKGNTSEWKPGRYVADFYVNDNFVCSRTFQIE